MMNIETKALEMNLVKNLGEKSSWTQASNDLVCRA